MIDRIAPTKRPDQRHDGTQRWASLLFTHWECDTSLIEPLLPDGLEIDVYDGKAYIGIVPFQMQQVRPRWLPRAMAFNFLETNVRTYVHCQGRPGVYFFSLDASSRLAVLAARIGWSLPYFDARMRHSDSNGMLAYESNRRPGKGHHAVSFRLDEHLGESSPGTLEHFLFERYLLFVQRGGLLHCGQVYHRPYDVWTANITTISDSLIAAAGLPDPECDPILAHYSPGVDVEVFGIRPVPDR